MGGAEGGRGIGESKRPNQFITSVCVFPGGIRWPDHCWVEDGDDLLALELHLITSFLDVHFLRIEKSEWGSFYST